MNDARVPRWLIIGVAGLAFGLAVVVDRTVGSFGYGLRINRSDSLPYTLFVSRPTDHTLKREEYVCFTHPGSAVPLVKQVVGIAGDKIERRADFVVVGDRQLRLRDSSKVTPIEDAIIPEGRIFVFAPHPESFDSRYSECGLIRTQDVKECVWPVF